MRLPVFFLFAILIFSQIQAQEKIVHGVIIIDLNDASPEGIYITNSRTKFTTITDLTGSFSLRAEAGDSLLIQSTFYESRRFYLTENLMKKDFLNIHLNIQPIALDEAVIMPKLTGFLDIDAANYKPGKDPIADLYKELGVNPDASKLRDSSDFTMWKDVSPFHLNVDKLYEVFSGDLRRRQNLYAFEGRETKILHIREYFGDEYFMNELQIPQEKIREFVYFSYETTKIPTFYANGNFLNIMKELSNMAPVYLSRLNAWQHNN
ncbi:hypothetical protein [Moheibacter lacus]|uniref:CarboxypepD_reg-like domain-containing protein n=1 Tax=Moheibacter lacus TaxID=2745851 RepID=A0A838ZMK9_9FLAO|nr:hypothetical protein [Moheibacter lacus]MBA5629774.1 hypothetical protein [Moheibacter lacus]